MIYIHYFSTNISLLFLLIFFITISLSIFIFLLIKFLRSDLTPFINRFLNLFNIYDNSILPTLFENSSKLFDINNSEFNLLPLIFILQLLLL